MDELGVRGRLSNWLAESAINRNGETAVGQALEGK